MTNITLERLEQIEKEREQTMYDEGFKQWFIEFNISQSYDEPSGRIKAREMMNQYDLSKYKYVINL
jgi:hypothetical protein